MRQILLGVTLVLVAVIAIAVDATTREGPGECDAPPAGGATETSAGMIHAPPTPARTLPQLAERRKDLWAHLDRQLDGAAAGLPTMPAQPDSWYECWPQYEMVKGHPKAVYRVAAGHLVLADNCLKSSEPSKRRMGVGIARQVTHGALNILKDKTLAVAVADVFLVPNLSATCKDHWQDLTAEMVIGSAARAYRESREVDKWVNACRLRLQYAHNRNAADAARLSLAQALDAQGNYQEAIDQLLAMTGSDRLPVVQDKLPVLRRKLAAREQSDKNRPGGTSGGHIPSGQ